MTTTAIKNRTHDRMPRIGILASTKHIANSWGRELGIQRAVALSPAAHATGRGVQLSALIVDEALWPLDDEVRGALLPTLAWEHGYVFRLMRVDPREDVQP
jgi:hypothetical protein